MSDKMEALVARLGAALEQIDWQDREDVPSLRAPATDAEIAALRERWERDLPPSLEAFLRLANGMEGAEQFDWAIAGATPPNQFETFEDIASGFSYALKSKSAKHPALAELRDTPQVAGADFDRQIVYFLAGEDDEPKLRRLSFDDAFEDTPVFASFTAFVEFVVDHYEGLAEASEAEDFDDELSAEDEALLRQIASLLDARKSPGAGGGGGDDMGLGLALEPEPEPEPEPELRLSPEMQLAADLCRLTLQKLLDDELVELIDDSAGIRSELEDYMLKKLLRSNSPQETMDAWLRALEKAREVEELWGTDEELKSRMAAAFEEIYAQKQS